MLLPLLWLCASSVGFQPAAAGPGVARPAGSQADGAATRLELPSAPGAAERLVAAWQAGERERAISDLERILLGAPHDAGHVPARLQLVDWLESIGRIPSALAQMEQLIESGQLPENDAYDARYGRLLFRLERFPTALEILPSSDAASLAMRCDAALALGQFEASDLELTALADLLGRHHFEVAKRDGYRQLRAGKPRAALACFDAALANDQTDPESLFGRGRALINLGEREAGLETLEEHRRILPLRDDLDFAVRSLALAPLHGPNHARLAQAQAALGRHAAASASYLRALNHSTPEEIVPVGLRAARHAEQARQLPDQAIELLDRAFERRADVRLLVRAGDIAARAGQTDAARARYDRALDMRPGDAQIVERKQALGTERPPGQTP